MRKKTCRKCNRVFLTNARSVNCAGCKPASTLKKKKIYRKKKRFHVDPVTGNRYRSKFEVMIADFFTSQNISFEYEVKYDLLSGEKYKKKIVDFRTKDYLVEATGLIRDRTGRIFVKKISLLRKVTDRKIVVVTYNKKIYEILRGEFYGTEVILVQYEDFEKLFI